MTYRHVYVHVPFCARRCSYCDFAIAVRTRTPVDEYVHALEHELAIRAVTPGTAPVETLYLGGGTPSRLGGAGVARVIDAVRTHLPLADDAEVTIEANPDDVDLGAVAAWRAAGGNRVSLGVQSFDPGVLAWMHRTHDAAAITTAAEALAAGGITNWSLDLIYALPPEVSRNWEDDLERAIALGSTHVSAYGLTVESGTPLARWRGRGMISDTPDERYEDEFLTGHDRLGAAGFVHYEVSNFARAGFESRHNVSYWRGVPYLGLGPGAHGFDGAVRRWNEPAYVAWRNRLTSGEDPVAGDERLTPEQQALEAVYIGLRSRFGVAVTPREEGFVLPWLQAGWGTLREGQLYLSVQGWLRVDALVSALTEYRSRY